MFWARGRLSASLAEITINCEFYDQAHLTRIFRRLKGGSEQERIVGLEALTSDEISLTLTVAGH